MIGRMLQVRDVLAKADLGLDPVEIYEVNLLGELIPLDESRTPQGRPRARATYAQGANAQAVAWKHRTDALPPAAKLPGVVRARAGVEVGVDHALPAEYAPYNLLPEVRELALSLFKDLRIPWHQGKHGGPTNHLRSSQVQCVNALGQMVADPKRIIAAFGETLDIGEVRDFGVIDPSEAGRYLTFEFVGVTDYFDEGRGKPRTRGANSTSVDAAFAYRTTAGVDELALVEWKFSEHYPSADSTAVRKLKERSRRYEAALVDEEGPIEVGALDLADLFHEPLYQLSRQQLLANKLERDPAVAAEVVRVVHVLSPDNDAYERSYVPLSLVGRGTNVSSVWQSLLRQPTRFVKVDPVAFLSAEVTSAEYVDRYGRDKD